MKQQAQWWHWLLAGSLVVALCGVLWRTTAQAKDPSVVEGIVKGTNADVAMTLNTTGEHPKAP